MKSFFCAVIWALSITTTALGAAPDGWTTYAAGGSVFRARVGGAPERVASNVGALHSCWSFDGSMIFYITNGGDIYAMDNAGGSRRKIGVGDANGFNKINAYRPEAKSVLCVTGAKFYKIDASGANPDKVEVASSNVSITGEIAISRDGRRIAFRSSDTGGGRLKKMTVGQNAQGYASNCSANISPDGQYLLENQSGHTRMKIFTWSGESITVDAGVIGNWDNQAFAVNSNDWICALDDRPTLNDNVGSGVGIVNRNNEAHMVTSWSGNTTMYPSFFVGQLPPAGSTGIAAPISVTNLARDDAHRRSVQLRPDAWKLIWTPTGRLVPRSATESRGECRGPHRVYVTY